MLNSSLIEILRSFTKEEIKSLQDFLESPYHNKKSSAVKLFAIIKKYYPELSSNKLHRENLWGSLFPDKHYNYGVMKNLIYDLTKLTEEFISLSMDRSDLLRKEFSIIKFFNDKNKYKLAEKYLNKTDNETKDSTAGDADYSMTKFNIEKIRMSILFSKIADKHKIMPGTEFEQSSKYLIESFLISLLENYVMISGLNKVHKSMISMPFLEEAMGFIKNNEYLLENFYLKSYYYILLLERDQDEKYYHILKNILSGIDINAPASFKYTLWENISNYVTFRYHAGETDIMREQFELLKLSLNKKIYSAEDEEKFFINNFITFFNVALYLGELDWASEFVDKYICKLDEKTQDDIRNHCLGSICINKKEFLKANEYFSKIKKLHEPHMKAGLKLSMLIVYYELGWYESSLSMIDTFKHLLNNEKNIQEVIKEKFRKFIRGYSLLTDIKFGKDENAKMKLKMYLEHNTGIGSVNWLVRKAKECGVDF